MVFIQFGKDMLHYRLTVQGGLGRYLEPPAILVYGRHLLLIEIQHLPVLPDK